MAKPQAASTATNTSTRHVLEAMRLISQSDEPLGLADVAQALGLPSSTAHRALMTLEESGFAERSRQGARFGAGIVLSHLIRSMVAQFPIRRVAYKPMLEISRTLDVTVSLNWRLGWKSIRLLSIEGSHEAYQLRRLGEQRPLHDGIGPTAILAALGEDEQKAYFARLETGADNGAGLDTDRYKALAEKMAKHGHVSLSMSQTYGLYWISVPLRRPDGSVVASLSVGFGDRDQQKLNADIEQAVAMIGAFQKQLDADPASTQSPFEKP